ncbi:hypothetical protein [Spirosoma sp.]|uniref:hypothetical protein n=1 Tax=Spirosoma sp. TaxID=1899569 RepID=UPI003B3BC512
MTKFYQSPVFPIKRSFDFSRVVLTIWVVLLFCSSAWAYPKKQSTASLDCTTPTFGSITYEPAEIYQGDPKSLTSAITGLLPNENQTFAFTIDGVAQSPVTAPSDAAGNVLNPFSYEPLRTVLSSVGVHVVILTSITVNGCSLQLSTNNSATITVKPAPDLTPVVYLTPAIQYSPSAFAIVVDVFELNGSPTNPNKTINVYLNKNSYAQVQLDATAQSVGGRPVANSVWSLDDSNPDYYILSTAAGIEGGSSLSFGLLVKLTPGGTSGIYSVGATISPSSGGELKLNNNVDVDKITYFGQ